MKKLLGCAAISLALLSGCKQSQETSKQISMENELDKVSYSLGVNVGKNIKQQGLKEINTEAFAQAIADVYADNTLLIDDEEAGATLQSYFQKLEEEKFAANIEEGKKFLEMNKQNEGVVELPSGLQYQVITEGNGPKPGPTDKVKTHYHGTLLDGTVFDSSVDRGEPISFPVNGVIKGWTEALQLMSVGSKWKLFIPSDLAYGARGAGGAIGPHSTLIFEVELLDIEKE